jgi:hypothetical protein
MLKRIVIVCGLLTLGVLILLALVRLTPASQADLFDSPVPTPWAYLPFVASKSFIPPPREFHVYLPVVVCDGPASGAAR